jgi:hypothetical protein
MAMVMTVTTSVTLIQSLCDARSTSTFENRAHPDKGEDVIDRQGRDTERLISEKYVSLFLYIKQFTNQSSYLCWGAYQADLARVAGPRWESRRRVMDQRPARNAQAIGRARRGAHWPE